MRSRPWKPPSRSRGPIQPSDLGFLALSFAFYEHRSLEDRKRQEYGDEVYELLETHYVNDLRLDRPSTEPDPFRRAARRGPGR